MIDHTLIIDRVKSLKLFRDVGGAAEFAGLQSGGAIGAGPNAYVMSSRDRSDPPKGPSGPQVTTITFGLVLMVRAHGDALGGATMNRLTPLRRTLMAGLLGWIPAEGYSPIWHTDGNKLGFDPEALWWFEEFSTRCTIHPALPTF